MDAIRFFNGVDIGIARDNDVFHGLRRIAVATPGGPVALRSSRRPMTITARTPEGLEFCSPRIIASDLCSDHARIVLSLRSRQGLMMDWMVHSVRNRLALEDWTAGERDEPGTTLTLTLDACERTIAGLRGVGFRYRWAFASRDRALYQLLDRSTWEIGATAIGNEFWLRNCFAPSIADFTAPGQHHASEWHLPDCRNPDIFQFLPLQTELPGFTFTAADAGALVTWATAPAHVRSWFGKPRDSELIVHAHQHCGDLGRELVSAPMEVLFFAGAFDRVQRINLWEGMRDEVSHVLHRQAGLRQERVAPYGIIEEWTEADLPAYTAEAVPALTAAGVRTIGLANHFETNMSAYGVSNMCCTVDHVLAGYLDPADLRRMAATAKAGGAELEMWGNTAISSIAYHARLRSGDKDLIPARSDGPLQRLLAKAADPVVRDPSGHPESDHYSPDFVCLNLRDPEVFAYLDERWRAARTEFGLGGIFLDSSFNISSDKFHFGGAGARAGATADQTHLLGSARGTMPITRSIQSQYHAHLAWVARLQDAGYRYDNEDLGVFGTHRHGPGIEARLDHLWMWPECIANYDATAIVAAGRDPDEVFVRGLAYRMMWCIYWDIASKRLSWRYGAVAHAADLPRPDQIALIRAFDAVNDAMRGRTVLAGERGVVYDGGGELVLWAFSDLGVRLPRVSTISDVLSGEVTSSTEIMARRHRVYRVPGVRWSDCALLMEAIA